MGNVVDEGVEYIVVWSGGELLPPRATIPDLTWEPPRRLYNKKAPVVVIGAHGATPISNEVVEENVMPTVALEVNDETMNAATKFLAGLNEVLGALQVQNEALLERLDDLETKIDNLSLYGNDGFSEVEGL